MKRVTSTLLITVLFCSVALTEKAKAQPPQDTAVEEPAQTVDIRSPALDAIQQAVEVIAANSAADPEATQRQEDIDFARRDVDAQEAMAKFTRLIYVVTAWGLLVGGVTVCFLGGNFIQNRILIRQNRAWITWVMKEEEPTPVFNDKPAINIGWMNSGQSPALNVRSRYGICATGKVESEHRLAFTKSAVDWGMYEWVPDGAIGAKQIFPIVHLLENLDLEQIKADAISFLILIEIEYQTIYPELGVRKSEAIFEVTYMSGLVNGLRHEGFNISAIGTGHTYT